MTIRPPRRAALVADARPELTGGRRIGVLLSHGFTGSPGLDEALGASTSPRRGTPWRCPGCPATAPPGRTCNKTTLGRLVRRGRAGLRGRWPASDAVVVGGLSMGGALALRLAADHPDRVAGLVLVNPAVGTDARTSSCCRCSSTSSRRSRASPTTSRSPGSRSTATPGPRSGRRTRCSGLAAAGRATSAGVTAPLLYFRSTVDHVVDEPSQPLITGAVSSRDVARSDRSRTATTSRPSTTTPTRIFTESAEFVARVTAP